MIYMIRTRARVCVCAVDQEMKIFQRSRSHFYLFLIELYSFFFHELFIPIFILSSVKMYRYTYAENRLIDF